MRRANRTRRRAAHDNRQQDDRGTDRTRTADHRERTCPKDSNVNLLSDPLHPWNQRSALWRTTGRRETNQRGAHQWECMGRRRASSDHAAHAARPCTQQTAVHTSGSAHTRETAVCAPSWIAPCMRCLMCALPLVCTAVYCEHTRGNAHNRQRRTPAEVHSTAVKYETHSSNAQRSRSWRRTRSGRRRPRTGRHLPERRGQSTRADRAR